MTIASPPIRGSGPVVDARAVAVARIVDRADARCEPGGGRREHEHENDRG